MEETLKPRSLGPGAFDAKRWVGAIVGGVVLGEALWSMLVLLIRDWATPAVVNLLGQGPTQNREAFEPQALLVAFLEVCLAGIVLVLILAWTDRERRVVRVSVARSLGAKERAAALVPPAMIPAAPPGWQPTEPAAPQPVVKPEPQLIETEPPAARLAPEPVPAATLVETPPPSTAPSAPKPSEVVTQPKPKAKPKKPKPVYYNIVGEPIESDDE